jgi:carboxypeptidase Taq
MTAVAAWDELVAEQRAIARLEEIRALADWDQQVGLPTAAHDARAEHLAVLAKVLHAHRTAPRLGDLLGQLDAGRADLDDDQRAGLDHLLRDWRREAAVPPELAERLGRLQGQGHARWMEAREARDFALFAPTLAEIVDVSRERAAAIDAARPAYDVMIDEYEPGATMAQLTPLLDRLEAGLRVLLDAVRGVAPLPPLRERFDPAIQVALSRTVAAALGFDGGAGRLDLSVHPFTITLGAGDVRITTAVDEGDLLGGLGGTVHEVGHALYEQGLPRHLLGTGLEGPASMGLHESQSRFWENVVGGSLAFFRWLDRPLRDHFGAGAPDPDTLYRAANRVVPGARRTSADEVTYDLHVIVRYQLEQRLIDGSLAVRDLRDAWNEAYRRSLGIDPVDDVAGVLQDIHWSAGAFGYFPTYTLGNLYAASFGRKLFGDRPELWAGVERGAFAPILAWLRQEVHRHGHRYDAAALVARVVGEVDPVEALLSRLWERHGALHGLARPA